MFTQDNTQGYTDRDLAELNRRLDSAMEQYDVEHEDEYAHHLKTHSERVLEEFDSE